MFKTIILLLTVVMYGSTIMCTPLIMDSNDNENYVQKVSLNNSRSSTECIGFTSNGQLLLNLNRVEDCFDKVFEFVKNLPSKNLICEGLETMQESQNLRQTFLEIVKTEYTKLNCIVLRIANRKCIENALHRGKYLFPTNKRLVKRQGNPVLESTGRVFAEFDTKHPLYYNKWIVIPNSKDLSLIYNEGMEGYLNVYDNVYDHERRDAFVGEDRIDLWKLHRHSTINGAFALQNIPTGEFLYATVYDHIFLYPGQESRSVFTWKVENINNSFDDKSLFWYIKDC